MPAAMHRSNAKGLIKYIRLLRKQVQVQAVQEMADLETQRKLFKNAAASANSILQGAEKGLAQWRRDTLRGVATTSTESAWREVFSEWKSLGEELLGLMGAQQGNPTYLGNASLCRRTKVMVDHAGLILEKWVPQSKSLSPSVRMRTFSTAQLRLIKAAIEH